MNQTWRLLVFSALLAFAASQFVHADHIFDVDSQTTHTACYVCQTHSAAALETHVGISIPTVSVSSVVADIYLSPIVSIRDYQRQVRAPPFA